MDIPILLLTALVAADVAIGGIFLALDVTLWLDYRRFKRRWSFSDPPGFLAYREWLHKGWII